MKEQPIGPSPICWACSRLRDVDSCDAFPDGIPRKVLFEHFDHRNPYPGDRGIHFDLKPGKLNLLRAFEEVEKILAEL